MSCTSSFALSHLRFNALGLAVSYYANPSFLIVTSFSIYASFLRPLFHEHTEGVKQGQGV